GSPDPSEAGPGARLKQLVAEIQALEESARKRLRAENPDLQPTQKEIVQALTDDERQAHETATARADQLKKTYKPPEVPYGRTVIERLADLKSSHLMV